PGVPRTGDDAQYGPRYGWSADFGASKCVVIACKAARAHIRTLSRPYAATGVPSAAGVPVAKIGGRAWSGQGGECLRFFVEVCVHGVPLRRWRGEVQGVGLWSGRRVGDVQ